MNMEFVKEIPAGQINWTVIGDELRAHPGLWGKVKTTKSRNSANATATNIRCKKYRVGRGTFNAASREQPDGSYAVYARYLPEVK